MNQKQPARFPQYGPGVMLAVFLASIVLASIWLFMQRRWWMPQLASVHGADIDRVFMVTLVISGVLFVLLQGILAYLRISLWREARASGPGTGFVRVWKSDLRLLRGSSFSAWT